MKKFSLMLIVVVLASCETAYYSTLEKVGIHKRDILVERIEEARESQQDGQEQFKDALEQFQSVVQFDGGDLEKQYNKLNNEYEDSVDAADEIRDRIEAVESVSKALFKEWEKEITLYSSDSLKRDSRQKLSETRIKYKRLISTMEKAESAIQPVLAKLQDNVLYLKHNLNARAISTLKGELGTVDRDVGTLIAAMEKSIRESDAFIAQLKEE